MRNFIIAKPTSFRMLSSVKEKILTNNLQRNMLNDNKTLVVTTKLIILAGTSQGFETILKIAATSIRRRCQLLQVAIYKTILKIAATSIRRRCQLLQVSIYKTILKMAATLSAAPGSNL